MKVTMNETQQVEGSPLHDNNGSLNVLVLSATHLAQTTGTHSKVANMQLGVYKLSLFRAVRQYIKCEKEYVSNWTRQPTFCYRVLRGGNLAMT